MLSTTNHQQETDEMKRLRQEADRAKREVDKLTKRLQFQEQEHKNRVNQLTLRNQSEQKDLARRQQIQLQHLIKSDQNTIVHDDEKIKDLKRQITRWEAAKTKATNDIEQKFKHNELPGQQKFKRFEEALSRDPEILRIDGQITRIRGELVRLERDRSRHQQEDLTAESRLERFQQTEVDKLTAEQQNKLKALEDAWLRESKALMSQIQIYDTMRSRTETQYKDLERQHKIDLKRMADMESRQRAQHGDDTAKKNYAHAGGENVLDPNSAAQQQPGRTRRMGSSRW